MIDKFFTPQQTISPDNPVPVQPKYKIEHIEIPCNHELRIQLNFQEEVRIKLKSGSALLMGMELSSYFYYKFPLYLKSTFIYSSDGCTIDLIYPEQVKLTHYCHDDEDQKNLRLLNFCEILETNRQMSLSKLCFGPRVMILGNSCSGKSTVLSILGNQAVSRNWNPIMLNLDPCGGSSDFPGIISVKSLSNFWYQIQPNSERLSFFFGSDELEKRQDLYIGLVKALMNEVENSLDSDLNIFKKKLESMSFLLEQTPKKSAFCSGLFIDTPTGIQDLNERDLKQFIDLVDPDYLLIIHSDILKTKLNKIYNNEKTIVSIGINGGVSSVTSHEKTSLISNKLQNFFYSDWAVFLRDSVKFDEISVYKLDAMESLPLSYVDNQENDKLKLTKLDPRITDLKGI